MPETPSTKNSKSGGLKKSFGLFALFIYGLGDILGAGIYALVGEVSLQAGHLTWLSFVVALLIAGLTALTYSELVVRFPKSGGACHFADQAFAKKSVTFTVGWLLLFVSIVSMATLTSAFIGYTGEFGIEIPKWVISLGFLAVLAAINFRGIEESSTANIIATSIEVCGLAIIVFCAFYFLKNSEVAVATASADVAVGGAANIFRGAAIAFYAFIGFEDLANVAEESKNPKRHMPIAILGSLITAGSLYILIGWLVPQVIDPATLKTSSGLLPEIVRKSGVGIPVWIFSVIALFAVANTCLLNFVTGSRLLYGMSAEGVVPRIFERLHKEFRTPYVAILFLLPVAFTLTLLGSLKFLASTTSVLILLVFCSAHIALITIKRKGSEHGGFTIPIIFPVLGLLASLVLISFADPNAMLAAGGIAVAGFVMYFSFFQNLKKRAPATKA